jgi:acyl-CoA dehydrogenase
VLKGWCTELGVEIASLGVQVHGGMGFIEETGAAQFLRDARIATIYEGTTGIQAADLAGRKLPADGGAAMAALIADMRQIENRLGADFPSIHEHLSAAIDALEQATAWMLETLPVNPAAAMAASVNYMMLTGFVCGGWQMARAAIAAHGSDGDEAFRRAKIVTATFYAEQILPKAAALLTSVRCGASLAQDLRDDDF